MKIIKQLPINGSVVIYFDKRFWHGNYGDKAMYGGRDLILKKSDDLYNNILEGLKFIEKYDPKEEDRDVPYMDYGDVDLKIEYSFIVEDSEKPSPRSWRSQTTYDTLHEAIEGVIGGIPCRSTYKTKNKNSHTKYHDEFKFVVEEVYNDPSCDVEGMDEEEKQYIDKLKQYLVLVELSK